MCGASFLAAFASTTIGAGGSLLLISIATMLPINVAIPVHAAVSFTGNLSRWAILHRFIDYKVVLAFAFGVVIGLALAAPLIGEIPTSAWQALLGAFLLVSTWWKPHTLNATGKYYSWACGVVVSFMSVFVGATKPFIATLLGHRMDDHKAVVGTTNACATLPHLGKIFIFAVIGASVLDYGWLIAWLVLAGILGTFVGRYVLIRENANRLRLLLKLFTTLLGVNLLLSGLGLSPWN
jgi:uncharacterized membrane protein YfcA